MNKFLSLLTALTLLVWACNDDKGGDEAAVYDPTPYSLQYGNYPTPDIPAYNLSSLAGVRMDT